MKDLSIRIKRKLLDFKKWREGNIDKLFALSIWAVLLFVGLVTLLMG